MRFRLAGIPVEVRPGFFLTAALVSAAYLSAPLLLLASALAVFVSILAHELGHALAFRAFGHPSTISLYFFGGLTAPARGASLTPRQDLLVTLAGPGAGLALWAALKLLLATAWRPSGAFAAVAIGTLLFVNLVWSLLNLVPILPLDGGRVAAALLRMRDPDSAERRALLVSLVCAGAGLALALYRNELWPAMLCLLFGSSNFQALRAQPRGGPEEGLRRELQSGFERLAAGEATAAADAAEAVLAQARESDVRLDAARLRAWAQLATGDPLAALERIAATPGLAEADPLLRGQALRAAGRPGDAVPVLQAAFDSSPGPASARALLAAIVDAGDAAAAERLALNSRAALIEPRGQERLAELLLTAGRPGPALLAAERGFAVQKLGASAWYAARASQQLGDEAGALRWLRKAEAAGLEGDGLLERAPELRPLLAGSELAELRRRLG